MNKAASLLITGLAPVVWGSTYLITTEMLPAGYPITSAMLRALPAGLLLLLLVRQLPHGVWIPRVILLGALNFSFFWWMLFEAAYRLPGGVAATVGAAQPLIVLYLSSTLIGSRISWYAIFGSIAGIAGIALLVLTPRSGLDWLGILAAFAGTVSMAFGTVLSFKWKSEFSALTFTAWQLIAGGLLLVPFAFWMEPSLPELTNTNIAGYLYLGLLGAAVTYLLWFRGIAILGPPAVSPLGLLSPVSAVILGWVVLGQSLSGGQFAGLIIVLVSVWLAQISQKGVAELKEEKRKTASHSSQPVGAGGAVICPVPPEQTPIRS